MKIAVVYTSTTPELIDMVETEIHRAVGENVELYSDSDLTILSETREAGTVTREAASRLFNMYEKAVSAGADVILNACSSVGDVANSAQAMTQFDGVPIVRIDEEMCREAVRIGTRIAVVATLPTTLNPTKNTILRAAKEQNRSVKLVDVLLDGAFGLSQDAFRQRIREACEKVADQVDVILFAQGSMAYCEEWVAQCTGKPTLSSPRFGAAALRGVLTAKGLMTP